MAKGIGGTLMLFWLVASIACAQDNPGPQQAPANVLPAPAVVMPPGPDFPSVPPVWQPEPCRTIAPYLLSPYPPPPKDCPPPPPSVDGPASIWFSGEYLLWWVRKGPESVPLVTTSSSESFGILDRSDTTVLFGGKGFEYRAFSGARLNLGFWFDDCELCGIDASGFFLERRPAEFAINSAVTGVPVIARPLINALTGTETSELVTFPGAFSGSIQVRSTSGLYGFDVNAITCIRERPGFSARLLAGFRYLHLDEDINIIQDSTLLSGGSTGFPVVSPDGFGGNVITAPASVHIVDQFHTTDQFYGGQVGVRAEYRGDWFCVDLLGKVAIGDVHQEGENSGLSSLTVPNQPVQTVTGGVLTLSSNIGRQVHDQFSVVPELGVNIGCRVTRHLTAYVGYSVLYWTDVARPGELINRTVNPTLLPTSQAFGTAVATAPAQPTSSLQHSDFWAQGVNFGLEFRY